MEETKNHRYLVVADILENQINSGVLNIGDKLPSVRVLHKEYGVSISTALQAYYTLESKGLIEARPQSGYYVRFSPKKLPRLPEKSQPDNTRSPGNAEEIISEVYKNIDNDKLVKFSLSVPSPELLPVAKLNKALLEAMRKLPANGINYENIQGNERLRRQIARLSLHWDGNLSGNDLVTTAGCMNALAYSLFATTERGDTIVVESPTYFGYLQLAANMGLNVIELPTDTQTGIDMDALSKTLKNRKVKACIITSNFNNPLSSCIPEENKKRIVRLMEHYNIPLIEDDIYGDVYFGNNRPKSCKTFDESGLVLWCGSVSKTLAPGYRVGWVAPGRYLEKINRLKMYQAVASTTIQQEATAIFLENGRYEHHLRRLRARLQANCLQYIRAISEYFPEGTRVSRPNGGFLLWVELNPRYNAYELYTEALKHDISISPGNMYTLQNNYSNCIRFSYGLVWNEKIDNALKTVGNILKKEF